MIPTSILGSIRYKGFGDYWTSSDLRLLVTLVKLPVQSVNGLIIQPGCPWPSNERKPRCSRWTHGMVEKVGMKSGFSKKDV